MRERRFDFQKWKQRLFPLIAIVLNSSEYRDASESPIVPINNVPALEYHMEEPGQINVTHEQLAKRSIEVATQQLDENIAEITRQILEFAHASESLGISEFEVNLQVGGSFSEYYLDAVTGMFIDKRVSSQRRVISTSSEFSLHSRIAQIPKFFRNDPDNAFAEIGIEMKKELGKTWESPRSGQRENIELTAETEFIEQYISGRISMYPAKSDSSIIEYNFSGNRVLFDSSGNRVVLGVDLYFTENGLSSATYRNGPENTTIGSLDQIPDLLLGVFNSPSGFWLLGEQLDLSLQSPPWESREEV